jgi:hypothetical protein
VAYCALNAWASANKGPRSVAVLKGRCALGHRNPASAMSLPNSAAVYCRTRPLLPRGSRCRTRLSGFRACPRRAVRASHRAGGRGGQAHGRRKRLARPNCARNCGCGGQGEKATAGHIIHVDFLKLSTSEWTAFHRFRGRRGYFAPTSFAFGKGEQEGYQDGS